MSLLRKLIMEIALVPVRQKQELSLNKSPYSSASKNASVSFKFPFKEIINTFCFCNLLMFAYCIHYNKEIIKAYF